jgi:hypothetical protein
MGKSQSKQAAAQGTATERSRQVAGHPFQVAPHPKGLAQRVAHEQQRQVEPPRHGRVALRKLAGTCREPIAVALPEHTPYL